MPEPPPIPIRESRNITVDLLDPVEWNPNEETDATFAALVESIKSSGFVEALLVAPKADGRFEIIAGEHRWRAAKVLQMPEVPCIVVEDYDEDKRKVETVRMNMLKGRLNPTRFTKLFIDLANKYGPDATRRMMAVTEDREFKRLYRDVRASLPPEIRKRLDRTKREITDVDDLAAVLKQITAEHGQQLQWSFILFQYGRRTHLMVRASERTMKNLTRIAEECESHGVDINDRLNELLEVYRPLAQGAA
jgi:ParB/RepB/Spo0J family partition protein